MSNPLGCLKHFEKGSSRSEPRFEPDLSASPLCSKVALADSAENPFEASPHCSKVALADSVEDPLEASPLCSKVALADPVEDPLEASPLCSKVALADPVENPFEASPHRSKVALEDPGELIWLHDWVNRKACTIICSTWGAVSYTHLTLPTILLV